MCCTVALVNCHGASAPGPLGAITIDGALSVYIGEVKGSLGVGIAPDDLFHRLINLKRYLEQHRGSRRIHHEWDLSGKSRLHGHSRKLGGFPNTASRGNLTGGRPSDAVFGQIADESFRARPLRFVEPPSNAENMTIGHGSRLGADLGNGRSDVVQALQTEEIAEHVNAVPDHGDLLLSVAHPSESILGGRDELFAGEIAEELKGGDVAGVIQVGIAVVLQITTTELRNKRLEIVSPEG
jgi:hypothetical protein